MIILFVAETGFHKFNRRKNSNRDISNCICDYVMRYTGLQVGYDYSFRRIDKTAVRYFYIINNNIRLFGNNLIDNVLASKIYAKPVVGYTRCEFNIFWSGY